MKRAVDLIAGLVGLIVIGPAMGVIAIVIRCVDGPPVIFRQQRPGLRGEPFDILKFRTMRKPEGPDLPGSSDGRVTRLGGFLRRTSLDELPQLLNVIRGDLSLVGPRPLRME